MTILTQPRYAAEHILSEAPGLYSRDNGTIASGSGKVAASTILAKVGGKFVPVALGATDGSQVAVAVNFSPVDATSADAPCVVNSRATEVIGSLLVYPATAQAADIAAINTELAAVGIIVR